METKYGPDWCKVIPVIATNLFRGSDSFLVFKPSVVNPSIEGVDLIYWIPFQMLIRRLAVIVVRFLDQGFLMSKDYSFYFFIKEVFIYNNK